MSSRPVRPSDHRGESLGRNVDRDPLEVLVAQPAGLVRDPQPLGQQQLQLVAKPLRQWLRSERSCGKNSNRAL